MSNQGKAATPTDDKELSYEQRVQAVLAETKRDEKGGLVLPENTPEDIAYAVKTNMRYRDTQAAYTKAQQGLKAQEATNSALTEKLSGLASKSFSITQEQREELEDLKVTNPDAWRTKLNEYDQLANAQMQQTLSEVSEKAKAVSEDERRRLLLNEFNQQHGMIITDDVLTNDVPPRFTKALENGEVTFEEFLSNVQTYLEKDKVVGGGAKVDNEKPDLGKAGGSTKPQQQAVEGSITEQYEKAIF